MNAIQLRLGRAPSYIRLLGYQPGDRTGGGSDQFEVLIEIADAPSPLTLGMITHRFQIEADGETFRVVIKGSAVKLIEVDKRRAR